MMSNTHYFNLTIYLVTYLPSYLKHQEPCKNNNLEGTE